MKITKVEIKDQMIRKEVTMTRSIIQNNGCIWITRYEVEQPMLTLFDVLLLMRTEVLALSEGSPPSPSESLLIDV